MNKKDWELGEVLGKGGSGVVYRALNTTTGAFAACKVVKQDKDQGETCNEIDLLKKLSHPNIVRMYGYEENEKEILIIMEFCESGSLRNLIERFGNLTETLASGYVIQILSGLGYLHEQGIVHRDIKAGNILITKEGVAKLSDFGISSRLESFAVLFEGSPFWMAPEVIELVGPSSPSDIWSLGCTVIELVSGAPPYYELEPAAALFRIVSDEFLPYPRDLSNVRSNTLII